MFNDFTDIGVITIKKEYQRSKLGGLTCSLPLLAIIVYSVKE
jgi:hypothetical protein